MKNQIRYLQNLFYDLLNDYGQVYLAVRFSEKTLIGNRGFTEEEKKKGLILVFNRRNYKNLEWTEDGSVIATLGFGLNNRLEKCFLYCEDIMSIFSPDAGVKFDIWNLPDSESQHELPEETRPEKKKMQDKKIVSLDSFRKSRA